MSVRDEGPNDNPLAMRNLYPSAPGVSTAQAGSAMTPSTTADTSEVAPGLNSIEAGFRRSLLGNPVKAWIALTVLLFGGMWIATRFRGSVGSANIRFGLYNIIAIVVIGIVGGSIAKVAAAKFSIPGISQIILAS